MLPVEVLRWGEGDKELRAVGVRARVRHRQNARARVPKLVRDFIFKAIAVDRRSATASNMP